MTGIKKKTRKKILAQRIFMGLLAAGVLYGGTFVSQAEASSETDKATGRAATDGSTEACNKNSTEFGDYTPKTPPENKYLTVGYVPSGINANANGNVMNLEASCNFYDYRDGGNLYKFKIYGGFVSEAAAGGNANSNTVNVNGGLYNIWELYGGFSSTGNADSNKVYIKGGNFGSSARIYGGQTANIAHSASGNLVEISDGTFNSGISIYGGTAGKTANQNAVNIKGGTFTNINSIYGGLTSQTNASANENTVNISDGSITKSTIIVGGEALTGKEAKSNKVIISGGEVTTEQIFGGYIRLDNTEAVVEANKVEITGGTVKIDSIHGGDTRAGIAKGNFVTIGSGAEVKFNNFDDIYIYGGSDNSGGRAEGNTVTIGTDLANAFVYGGYATQNATENKVLVTSGNITGYITGGYSSSGEATGNIVELRGAKVIGTVQGGSTDTGTAHDNIIKVYAGDLSGALLNSDKIEIHGKGLNIQHITDFKQLDFYIPKDAVNGDTLVNITGDWRTTLAEGTKVNAGVMAGSKLKEGDTLTLLHDAAGITNNGAVTGKLTKGVSLEYDLDIAVNLNDITATIKSGGGTLKEATKSLTETRAAGMAVLRSGGNLLAEKGMVNAQNAADIANAEAGGQSQVQMAVGFTPFAVVGGNNMRYETGSYVNVRGWGLNIGMSRKLHYSDSTVTIAPLFEYGRGNYDSHLDDGTRGDGYQQYFGIGCMLKQEKKDGMYYEGSLRLGRMKGDYSGALEGRNTSYDTASNYYALHAGVGKVFKSNEKSTWDVYGKLFYTHQGADNGVALKGDAIGEVYDFDAVNSYRLRIGTRWTQDISQQEQIYAGVAWDYEFDGDARASFNGMSTPTPSLKGSSGMLELGWKSKSTKTNPISLDIGVQGWAGKQRGVNFSAGFNWEF